MQPLRPSLPRLKPLKPSALARVVRAGWGINVGVTAPGERMGNVKQFKLERILKVTWYEAAVLIIGSVGLGSYATVYSGAGEMFGIWISFVAISFLALSGGRFWAAVVIARALDLFRRTAP